MKIRTNLLLLSVSFVIFISAIGFIMFNTFGQINREIKKSQMVHSMVKEIFDLNIVTYEYLMHKEKRMQIQWQLKYNSIGGLFERMRNQEIHPENVPIIDSMTADYKIFGDLISQLQVYFSKRKELNEENKFQGGMSLLTPYEERYVTAILMKSHRISSEAFRLSNMIGKNVILVQQRANLIIMFSIIGVVVLSSFISFLTIKAITGPINKLVKGTKIIGKGDLEYKFDLGTKNEIGHLATSFNKMTKNLHKIIVSKDELEKEVTERKQAQDQVLRYATVLEAINEVFQETMTCETEEELGKICLSVAEKLTGSKFGFYGELNPEGLMDDIAISNPGWDACKMAVSDARRYIKNMPIKGIDRSTIRDGKSRIVNDDEIAIHPDRVGTPDGHPKITAFLGIPLKYEGKIIGMIGLGNKEGGYVTYDQEAMESLAVAIVEAMRKKRGEEIIREYSENLERMVEERTEKLSRALQETEEGRDKIDVILKSVADGLIVTDRQNRVVLMNKAAEELLNIRLSDMIGRPIDFAIEDKTLREKIKHTFEEKTTGYQFDFELPTDDPKILRIMRTRTSVIKDKKGKKMGIVMIMNDVSQERDVDRMKTEFLSTAAHELRTPLTSIQGFSEILLNKKNLTKKEIKRFLTYINDQAVNLASIVNDLLDISRIESGKGYSLHKVTCDINEMINEIISYYDKQENKHTFKISLSSKTEESFLDKDKIEQILKNIIDNAIKYSPKGDEIRITGIKENNDFKVSVQDQGIGMTSQQVDKIFDKFYRVDTSDSAPKGTGLGMTIVKYLVEVHGGKVCVESEIGRGTTVSFAIPLKSNTASNHKEV